jgi:SAM-dependent methyltransferase
MDARALEFLRCPVSRARLETRVIEAESAGGRRLVKTGLLCCADSRLWYPIINHVPVMLTFATPLVARFARDHAGHLAEFAACEAPALDPMPGERSVQKTFTEEWSGLGADDITFIYTDDELLALHRDVWLHLPPAGDPDARTVLDVGCGFGREAKILAEIFANADVFAVDLNLSLLEAAETLKGHPRLHPVIASLFHLPFAHGSVDHLHSQGVIHHTFSTERAFDAIARFPRPGGSLFVWVYAEEDASAVSGLLGALRRAYSFVSHRIGRPILSRLPSPARNLAVALLGALLHPVFRLRSRHRERWRLRNTLHSVRDAFTPRYAHLHRFDEVLGWFEQRDFATVPQSATGYRTLIGKPLLGVGILGRRREAAARQAHELRSRERAGDAA